jgi:hypothetical protein
LCEIRLKAFGETSNGLSLQLIAKMKERSENLMNNNAFLSALFLDPRYSFDCGPDFGAHSLLAVMIYIILHANYKKALYIPLHNTLLNISI